MYSRSLKQILIDPGIKSIYNEIILCTDGTETVHCLLSNTCYVFLYPILPYLEIPRQTTGQIQT